MTHALADFGITAADYHQIATDALDGEVLANPPRAPDRADILAVLAGRPGMPAMPADPGRCAAPPSGSRDDEPLTGGAAAPPAAELNEER